LGYFFINRSFETMILPPVLLHLDVGTILHSKILNTLFWPVKPELSPLFAMQYNLSVYRYN